MNYKDILEFAAEAGCCYGQCCDDCKNTVVFCGDSLSKFVEYIKQRVQIEQMQKFSELAEITRQDERERCAKVCDELVLEHVGRADLTAIKCAAEIRASGKP